MSISRSALRALAATLCGTLIVSSVVAQDVTRERRSSNRSGTQASPRAGLLDSRTTGASVRASQLIGMNIENSREESVGEINDIVLDSRTGRIQYLAVTYGGFLGVGNKMFAVPYEAIEVRRDPDDRSDSDDYVLVMDVTQAQLEGAEGFDEDHWPNFSNSDFANRLYERYGVDRRRRDRRLLNRDRDVDVNIDRNGIDVDVDNEN